MDPLAFPTDFSKNRFPVRQPYELDPHVVLRHESGLIRRKQKTTAPRDAHGECTFPDTWYEVLIRRKQGVEVEAGLVARIQDLRLECRAEQRKLLKILRCSSSLIRHEEVY